MKVIIYFKNNNFKLILLYTNKLIRECANGDVLNDLDTNL